MEKEIHEKESLINAASSALFDNTSKNTSDIRPVEENTMNLEQLPPR